VGGQHRLVRARGGVEGDLLAYGLASARLLLLGVADDHEPRRRIREVFARAGGGAQAFVHRRMNVLAQVLRAVEGVHVQAVADFTGHTAHVGVDAGDVDGDVRVGDRPRAEERGHEVETVELPLEVEPRAVLPAIPDRAQGLHDLAELRARRFELHREAPLVVALHLRAEAEDEATDRRGLQVPGDVRGDHRAPWKRDRDRGAEPQARGRGRGHGQRQIRIVLGFGRPETVEAQRFNLAGVSGNRPEVVGEHADVELHS
jgi:hypothetical protein